MLIGGERTCFVLLCFWIYVTARNYSSSCRSGILDKRMGNLSDRPPSLYWSLDVLSLHYLWYKIRILFSRIWATKIPMLHLFRFVIIYLCIHLFTSVHYLYTAITKPGSMMYNRLQSSCEAIRTFPTYSEEKLYSVSCFVFNWNTVTTWLLNETNNHFHSNHTQQSFFRITRILLHNILFQQYNYCS